MDAAKEFLKYLANQDISSKTKTDYITDIKIFMEWLEEKLGQFEATSFSGFTMNAYKKFMLYEKEYKPRTINRKLSSLYQFGQFLKSKGYIEKNPIEEIEALTIQPLAPQSLRNVEVLRLFNILYSINNKRDIAIISTLYNTGIRNGELAKLRLADIELNERSGYITIGYSKRDKTRKVPLNKDARKAIKEYLDVRPRTPGASPEEERLEPLLKGERGFMTTSGIYRVVKKYGAMANIPVKTHSLRHTFIRNMLDNGTDNITIASITGLTLETLKIYGQPRKEHIEKAVESIEISNLLFKAENGDKATLRKGMIKNGFNQKD